MFLIWLRCDTLSLSLLVLSFPRLVQPMLHIANSTSQVYSLSLKLLFWHLRLQSISHLTIACCWLRARALGDSSIDYLVIRCSSSSVFLFLLLQNTNNLLKRQVYSEIIFSPPASCYPSAYSKICFCFSSSRAGQRRLRSPRCAVAERRSCASCRRHTGRGR